MDPATVIRAVCAVWAVSPHTLRRGRTKVAARVRQVVAYLLRLNTDLTLAEIAFLVGCRDHTTILHAVRRVATLRRVEPLLRARLDTLESDLLREGQKVLDFFAPQPPPLRYAAVPLRVDRRRAAAYALVPRGATGVEWQEVVLALALTPRRASGLAPWRQGNKAKREKAKREKTKRPEAAPGVPVRTFHCEKCDRIYRGTNHRLCKTCLRHRDEVVFPGGGLRNPRKAR